MFSSAHDLTDKDPSRTETPPPPGQRPSPRRNMRPETEIPLEGTWDQSAGQEVTSYRDQSAGQEVTSYTRMTHASKNITLPQTSFAGGNNCKFILWTLHCRLAHSASEQHREALECYRKALELDPSNASYQQNIEIAEQKVRETVCFT